MEFNRFLTCGASFLPPRAFLQMRQKQHQSGGGHAVEPRRLTEACRAIALQLLPKLVGEPRDAREGEVERDGNALFFAEGGDVDVLALQINGVARVDGE